MAHLEYGSFRTPVEELKEALKGIQEVKQIFVGTVQAIETDREKARQDSNQIEVERLESSIQRFGKKINNITDKEQEYTKAIILLE